MAGLSISQIIDYIKTNLPDNQRLTAESLRDVLVEMTESIGSIAGDSGVKKYGYQWIKGQGNVGIDIEVGDELKRVGTLYPGYWVHLLVYSIPIDEVTPSNSVKILISSETT